MRRIQTWHWVAAQGVIAVLWAASAAGSYAYLTNVGWESEWRFPWLQIWVAAPTVLTILPHDLAEITALIWCLAGLIIAIFPLLIAARLVLWQRDRQQRSLYGDTGWATRQQMRRGGITSRNRPL